MVVKSLRRLEYFRRCKEIIVGFYDAKKLISANKNVASESWILKSHLSLNLYLKRRFGWNNVTFCLCEEIYWTLARPSLHRSAWIPSHLFPHSTPFPSSFFFPFWFLIILAVTFVFEVNLYHVLAAYCFCNIRVLISADGRLYSIWPFKAWLENLPIPLPVSSSCMKHISNR